MTYEEARMRPGVTLIEFYASWCPHCRRMMPVVEDVKARIGGVAGIYQFDIDENQSAAEAAGADSVPTFIVYKDGEEKWRNVGEMPADEIIRAITSAK